MLSQQGVFEPAVGEVPLGIRTSEERVDSTLVEGRETNTTQRSVRGSAEHACARRPDSVLRARREFEIGAVTATAGLAVFAEADDREVSAVGVALVMKRIVPRIERHRRVPREMRAPGVVPIQQLVEVSRKSPLVRDGEGLHTGSQSAKVFDGGLRIRDGDAVRRGAKKEREGRASRAHDDQPHERDQQQVVDRLVRRFGAHESFRGPESELPGAHGRLNVRRPFNN